MTQFQKHFLSEDMYFLNISWNEYNIIFVLLFLHNIQCIINLNFKIYGINTHMYINIYILIERKYINISFINIYLSNFYNMTASFKNILFISFFYLKYAYIIVLLPFEIFKLFILINIWMLFWKTAVYILDYSLLFK